MRVLHAIHDFLPRHWAGSEIYTAELARAQAEQGAEVHVLCAEYDPARANGSLDWRWLDDIPVTEVVNNWCFGSFAESYRAPAILARLEHVLRAVQPDILHIHNLLNLSFDLPAAAARLGVPSVATLHEYVLLCPSGGQRIHLAEQHVCHDIDPDRCARCFRQSPLSTQMTFAGLADRGWRFSVLGRLGRLARRLAPRLTSALVGAATTRLAGPMISAAEINERLAAARRVFDAVELLVAPSPSLGAELVRFGLPSEKLLVRDYGFPPLPVHARWDGKEKVLRIGFAGTLAWHKGAHVLLAALRLLPQGRCRLTLYGATDTFPDYSARLRDDATGLPVHFAGAFDRGRVAEVYAEIDVLVVPSLWLENSPLVIHEAFQAGVPVIGSALGGTADLIRDGVNGLLYEATSAAELAAALRRLLDEPELRRRLAEGAASTPVIPINEDAEHWLASYQEVLDRQPRE